MTRTRIALSSDSGASAVEYAILIAAIAVVIVAVVFALGILTRSNVSSACTAWDTAAHTSGNC